MLLLLEGEDERQGSTHRLSQGRVPLSSCRMVGGRLTGEKYNPVTADWGGKQVSTHRLLPQYPRGRGSNVALSWCPPGECRCTKRFLSGSAALSPRLCLGEPVLSGLFFVSAGIYDLWVSLVLRLGYTSVKKKKIQNTTRQLTSEFFES